MENFLNVDAKGVNPSKISGADIAGDIGGMIGGQVVSSVIAGAFGRADAKKTRQLQEEMAKLDLAQQKQLAERLQNVQGEIAKQQAYYEFMAVQNNNEMLNKLKSKRYTSYIVLGGGVFALALVVILLKKKKNG